jgi:NAD(P)-dependent dehydrogenase (short-subunit alcohol dehydrogenase family)
MTRIALKPINEQVVVIMGASSGIGRQTALQFAKRGAKLVVAARGAAKLESLVEQIRQAGGTATAITADVTDVEQVKAVADRALAVYGRLDTWVHVAAVVVYARFEDTSPAEWQRVIDVNLNGQAYGALAALPHLRREGRGALIHVSSVTAKRSFPLISAYGASKQGVNGMLESLRVELREEGVPISVTNVLPASINTPLFNAARTKLGVKPKPASPVYQPNIVADAIVYAAEHPVAEIYAGGAARAMIMPQAISARLMDVLVLRFGFRTQQTMLPKSADAPTNLWEPIDDARIEGDFGDLATSKSPYTWLATRPVLRRALGGIVLGAGALLAARRARTP